MLETILEPEFISIDDAARYTGESRWTVKDLLARGIYRGKKAGRRTLVVFASVKERAATPRRKIRRA